ncbi:hypothetical protein CK203_033829 [Vitis vinifera]|uniref:Uncharacterized protein n=1 Tax=Vitis vinifera TaxID=29760 RepID=A0A438IQ75_VITVI|nr:hypothetical protein CK203_033829 [Vitis vinifera]
MSDEITPITLTALYEMMVDLTRRVERIELILSGHPSSSRGAPGVAMPSLPHLTHRHLLLLVPHIHGLAHIQCSSSIPHPFHWLRRHDLPPSFGPSGRYNSSGSISSPSTMSRHFSDLSAPLSRVFETLQAMGFLAPLAPRALPDPVPPQFRLDLYCAYHHSALHADAHSPAVPDLIDLGD